MSAPAKTWPSVTKPTPRREKESNIPGLMQYLVVASLSRGDDDDDDDDDKEATAEAIDVSVDWNRKGRRIRERERKAKRLGRTKKKSDTL